MTTSSSPDRRFALLFEQSGIPQAIVSPDGRIAAVNAATCDLFDRSPDEVVGELLLDRVPDDGREADAERLDAVLRGELARTQFERRLDHRDGRSLDALVSVAGIRGDDGSVSEVLVSLQDISDLKAAQREAAAALARWRSLSQNASDIAVITDAGLRVTYASPSLLRLLGQDDADVIGSSLLEVVHPDDVARVDAATQLFLQERSREMSLRFRMRSGDGTWRYVEQRLFNLLEDPDVTALVAHVRDASVEQELQRTLRRALLEDALTGLPNRTLLMDRVAQTLELDQVRPTSYALLFLNVDRLAAINESMGQAVGDRVLQRAAEVLCSLVGPADTVARFAGDEFAVLLADVQDREDAEALARRVTAALNTTLELDGPPLRLSAAVGLAFGPAPTAEALISSAQAGALRAKTAGRGRLHVMTDGVGERVSDQRALGGDLARAVAQEQLAVHYQPILELTTGRLVSFEALVRWPHPERGLLGPAAFLQLADDLDLLGTIDAWVLREACRTARTWPDGPSGPVTVAVNVAPDHLTQPGFPDVVRSALAESQLPPSALVLEITETAVLSDIDVAQTVLAELCALGVRVAIDDFGTGYSSMLQLRELPFEKLKIDREFVRRLPENSDDVAICASVISLAGRLGVRSIAEGVETEAQAAALIAMGCGFGQGFLWSPAVPADRALDLLGRAPWSTPDPTPPRRPRRQDPDDNPVVVEQARSMHDAGASLNTIAARLNSDGLRTPSGRRWHPASVARLLYRTQR